MEHMYTSITSDQIMAKWMAELSALLPKKQKKWKGKLFDKWNVAQKVPYNPVGKLVEGSSGVCHFEVYKQPDRPGGGCWWPVLSEIDIDHHTITPLTQHGTRLREGDTWNVFNDIQAETHTGNHYRNLSVRVPTRAGQPVRA